MASVLKRGIAASPGVVTGCAFVYKPDEITIPRGRIRSFEIPGEEKRFLDGRRTAFDRLGHLVSGGASALSPEELEVFEGHMEILMDEDLEERVLERIRNGDYALRAVSDVIDEDVREMYSLDDAYMRERAGDIVDIGRQLMSAVAGRRVDGLDTIREPSVVVARELTPSETALMDKAYVKAFVTETGGAGSHAAIMAKSLEIPAVVGAGDLLNIIQDGDLLGVDGSEGFCVVNPDAALLADFQNRIESWERLKDEWDRMATRPGQTADGHRVELCANVGTDADVDAAVRYGAEGIGLFRTEFLFIDRDGLPGEDEQFEAYRRAAEAVHPGAVIIRTMDIGGDKPLKALKIPREENPFLGWRAIRICLDRPELFKVQLRAILRAAACGQVRVMFPMINSLEEVRLAKALLSEAADELEQRGAVFRRDIEVGLMMETPAAAVTAAGFIGEVDFFSIGTNDLTQYMLAVDRGNPLVASLYQPLHPGVLTLIKRIIDSAHFAGKWTGMCGELASHPEAVPVLVGMGLDELSMSPSSLGQIKHVLCRHSMEDLKNLASKVLAQTTTSDILSVIELYT